MVCPEIGTLLWRFHCAAHGDVFPPTQPSPPLPTRSAAWTRAAIQLYKNPAGFRQDLLDYPNYPVEERADDIRPLLDAGYEEQLLLSHDTAPYFYRTLWQEEKRESDWVAIQGRLVDADPVGCGAETERGGYHESGGQQDSDRQSEESAGVLMTQ